MRTLFLLMSVIVAVATPARAQSVSYSNSTTFHFNWGTSTEFGDVLNLAPSGTRHTVTRVDFAFNNPTASAWTGTLTVRLYDGEPFRGNATAHQQSFPGITIPRGDSVRAFNLVGAPAIGSVVTATLQGLGNNLSVRWFDPPSVGSSGNYFVVRDGDASEPWRGLWFGPDQQANAYAQVWSTSTPLSPPEVRAIYLVPLGVPVRACAVLGIEQALRHLQQWYQQQMGDGRTFTLHDPVVEIIQTSHDPPWYRTNGTGAEAGRFWENALADGFALTGGRFNDPRNRWLYYIDADTACQQYTGGTQGVALLPANDLRGLIGEQNIPACPGQPPDNSPVCRWTGGLGHELGHALDLPHPPGCEDQNPDTPCPGSALMWTGYAIYPIAVLLPEDRAALAIRPFFTVQPPYEPSSSCGAIPQVINNPRSVNARAGQAIALSVGVVGAGPMHFVWRRNGTIVNEDARTSGARTAVLTILNTMPHDTGEYDAAVDNACASIRSLPARVMVLCPADFDNGSGAGIPDGGVTIDDLLYYLTLYSDGVIRADLDDGTGTGTPDGGVTIDDLLYYLFRFENGC